MPISDKSEIGAAPQGEAKGRLEGRRSNMRLVVIASPEQSEGRSNPACGRRGLDCFGGFAASQ